MNDQAVNVFNCHQNEAKGKMCKMERVKRREKSDPVNDEALPVPILDKSAAVTVAADSIADSSNVNLQASEP